MNVELKKTTVKDIMTKSVVSVDASATVNEAAKIMEDTKVGAIVVMENNSPIGIVTDRDFAIKVAAHAYPITTPIKKIMSSPLISISPEESIWMVADLMFTRGVRKIPIIDDDKIIGIVTATDIVNQLAISTEEDMIKMYHQSVVKIYERYNPYN